MKALSIRQPWASLILARLKDVENRSRPTKYRGPLLIHAAGAGALVEDVAHAMTLAPDHAASILLDFDDLPRGAIIGQADLVFCGEDHTSPWAEPGAWHWVLANAKAFDQPVPYPGRLGLFDAPDPDADHLFKPHDGTTRRVCLRDEPCDVVITRPGRWGNPWKVARVKPDEWGWRWVVLNSAGAIEARYREPWEATTKAISLYSSRLHTNPVLRQLLPGLKGKRLGCFCPAGAPCHGDVLVELVEEMR